MLSRSIGRSELNTSIETHESPYRSVSRKRDPRVSSFEAYPAAPTVSSQSMFSDTTPGGRSGDEPAGTVGIASIFVPAIACACARAPLGSAVPRFVIGDPCGAGTGSAAFNAAVRVQRWQQCGRCHELD